MGNSVKKTNRIVLALDYVYSFLKSQEDAGRQSELFAYSYDESDGDSQIPTPDELSDAIEWIGQQVEL